MSGIQIMAESLANQIAAGEVVVRPASVVKELIENSLDAGANTVQVNIKEAGLSYIAITDNGRGIQSDEVPLAFERHATSKLTRKEDLFRIRTLGFRGEALPSIASVSKTTIETAESGKPGKKLVVRGGDIIEEGAAPARPGTKVIVEDLFYNTPARLKHIKTLQTELNHITDLLNRYALACPDVSFELISDDSRLLYTVGNGDLRQALAGVYGVDNAKKMTPIEGNSLNYQVKGYISNPDLTRATNKYITLIINGRVIRSYRLTQAIIKGYGTKLMVGRFPIAVLQIEMDPQLLDVNVHPTKHEVRISEEQDLGTLIRQSVEQALQNMVRIPEGFDNIYRPRRVKIPSEQLSFNDLRAEHSKVEPFDMTTFSKNSQETENTYQKNQIYERDVSFEESEPTHTRPINALEEDDKHYQADYSHDNAQDPKDYLALAKNINEHDQLSHEESFPELDYIGQLHGTYLLTQNDEGLYIIDQHAAQERIKYEEYRLSILNQGTALQSLLTPIMIHISPNDFQQIINHLDLLAELGIHFESLGQQTLVIREHPSWMPTGKVEQIVRDMLDFILVDQKISLHTFREATAIMMSCKRSIKANHHLSANEACQLISDLSQAENPYNCPHGRPVMVRITLNQLEKMFKRIQDPH